MNTIIGSGIEQMGGFISLRDTDWSLQGTKLIY